VLVPTSLEEFDEAESIVGLRQANERLQRQLKEAKDREQRLVDATLQGAYDAFLSMGKMAPVPVPKTDRRRKPEAALLHLTDWQGAKLTTSYNSQVMRERVLRFMDKVESITEIQRKDHPVKQATILFGGDMVEGLFQFPSQPFEIDATIFDQYVNVSRLLVDVTRRALAIFETVTVLPEWGNHGRLGSKRDAIPRSDNIDRLCYELAKQLLAGETRLLWNDCPEDIQHGNIGNYSFLSCHGDEVGRNGYASPTGLVNWVVRQQSGAYPHAFTDVYMGHYHVAQSWSLPSGKGRLFLTGSTESDNRYAGVMLAASATPSQRLHFVDPEKGRVSAEYLVWLD
jgi:hypothetical protein